MEQKATIILGSYQALVSQISETYNICEELPHKLRWTHFCELVKIDDPLERSFYEKQAILENWSTTELIRQKKSSFFLHLAASKDDLLIQYVMHNISSHLFVNKYQLYLPNRQEFQQIIEMELNPNDKE